MREGRGHVRLAPFPHQRSAQFGQDALRPVQPHDVGVVQENEEGTRCAAEEHVGIGDDLGGRIDRQETIEYMDLAERWLTGWKAPVVRALTFGFIDPRQRVDEEVRKALAYPNQLLNTNLYWMALQMTCRVAFGLALWLIWALFISGA